MNANAKEIPEDRNLTKLKRLQRRHNLNAREIAEILGYKYNTVRKWRCGLIRIPDRAIKTLQLLLK